MASSLNSNTLFPEIPPANATFFAGNWILSLILSAVEVLSIFPATPLLLNRQEAASAPVTNGRILARLFSRNASNSSKG
jgi:hypothetical protein